MSTMLDLFRLKKSRIKFLYFTFLLFACLLSAFSCNNSIPAPSAELSNGIIHATIYKPDVNHGFYRGSRFDWSGIISNLEWNGHTFFGPWKTKYSGTFHDDVMGPAEEFLPVNYSETLPGNAFLKIGVGMLTRLDSADYDFQKRYPIADTGKWQTMVDSTQATFTHTLTHRNYSYTYSKTLRLQENSPVLVLEHSLKNQGKSVIATQVYNHNFLVMDQQHVGPDFEIILPRNSKKELAGYDGIVEINQSRLKFLEKSSEEIMIKIDNLLDTDSSEYNFAIENKKINAGLRITSDKPITKLMYWSVPRVMCPEPYIDIYVEPGEEICWDITYEFYSVRNINETLNESHKTNTSCLKQVSSIL